MLLDLNEMGGFNFKVPLKVFEALDKHTIVYDSMQVMIGMIGGVLRVFLPKHLATLNCITQNFIPSSPAREYHITITIKQYNSIFSLQDCLILK